MKKGKKKDKTRSFSKTSAAKLSNKKLNKIAKKGQLKKHLSKDKYLQLLKQKVGPQSGNQPKALRELNEENGHEEEEPEQDIPLVEADYEYFDRPDRNLNFLTGLPEDDQHKKRRKKRKLEESDDEDNDEIERYYENSTRGDQFLAKKKSLLPIKGHDGAVIARSEDVEQEEEQSEEEEMEVAVAEPSKPLPALSVAQLFALRHKKLEDIKSKIAQLGSSILENPEENISKLRELRLLLDTIDPDVAVTTRKLVLVSLMEVFKDIIPSYRIRVATEKEKAQSAKKETIQLRNFEESLVNNYQLYLEHMEALMKGKIPKPKDKKIREMNGKLKRFPKKSMQSIIEICVKCMGELLITHPHFNFRTNIITALMPFTVKKNNPLSDTVCEYVCKIFKQDKEGEVTLEIVRTIGRIIKARHFRVPSKVIRTFLSLKIKQVMTEEDKKDTKQARKMNIRNMSKKDRKRHKEMAVLTKELENASMEKDSRRTRRVHTEIINMVFLTYFRILKLSEASVLLADVLEGLAKFAHLINVEFFDDLFSVINQLVDSDTLTYRESLHCVQTAFTILCGQGESLNIDPIRFYRHLYASLFKLHAGTSSPDLPIAMACLDLMISKRRKQVSHTRVVGFVKRLTALTLQLEGNGALSTLAITRNLLHVDKKSDILLDTDEGTGSGIYLPEIDDPEHCNASNTALYELHTLKRHYLPVVRKYASHICAGAPSQGAGQLPMQLAQQSYRQLFSQHHPDLVSSQPEPPAQRKGDRIKSFRPDSSLVQREMQSLMDKHVAAIEEFNLPDKISFETSSKKSNNKC